MINILPFKKLKKKSKRCYTKKNRKICELVFIDTVHFLNNLQKNFVKDLGKK